MMRLVLASASPRRAELLTAAGFSFDVAPAAIDETPANVVTVDCDSFNGHYDRLGHSYFLAKPDGQPGALLVHLIGTLRSGRVEGTVAGQRRLILTGLDAGAVPAAANTNNPGTRSGLAEMG